MDAVAKVCCHRHLGKEALRKENGGNEYGKEDFGNPILAVVGHLRIKASHGLFYDRVTRTLPRIDTTLDILDIGKPGLDQDIGSGNRAFA